MLVLRETGSAAAVSAVWLAGQFVPALVGPLLVARAERIPTRVALPALLTAEVAVFAALAAARKRLAPRGPEQVRTLDADRVEERGCVPRRESSSAGRPRSGSASPASWANKCRSSARPGETLSLSTRMDTPTHLKPAWNPAWARRAYPR